MKKMKLEGSQPTPVLPVCPVVLVGSVVDGKPDFAAVAWVGVAANNPPAITVSLQPHRYSLRGILQNMNFSVNIPSIDILPETDYCGMISGRETDKVADTGLKIFYGGLSTVPLIEQCPVNHACEVVEILNLGSHRLVVGTIKETFVTEGCMEDGRPDIARTKPFFFSLAGKYTGIGETVGEAFRTGTTVSPDKFQKNNK